MALPITALRLPVAREEFLASQVRKGAYRSRKAAIDQPGYPARPPSVGRSRPGAELMPRRIEPFRAAPADFDAFMTTSLSIIRA